jgi:hypothetical protein
VDDRIRHARGISRRDRGIRIGDAFVGAMQPLPHRLYQCPSEFPLGYHPQMRCLLLASFVLACTQEVDDDDAGRSDAGRHDAGRAPFDAGTISFDAGAGPFDAGRTDAGTNDAGDDGGMDSGAIELDAGFAPIPLPPYTRISETGGYADLASGTPSPHAIEFTPRYRLWTDGAGKRRWIILPRGATIDTSNPDRWVVPVGTRVFKEFSLPGGRLETRLIQRVGATGSRSDWWLGAFIWNSSRTEAFFSASGQENVLGTNHDVPSVSDCQTCHEGESGRVLGFSTVQLSGATPFDLGDAIALGILSDPPAPSPVPGTAIESAAGGYLHANCGHCHNPRGDAWGDTDMILRISAGESVFSSTLLYRSTVNVDTDRFRDADYRIRPDNSGDSCVHVRMSTRDGGGWRDGDQMPPLGTEIVDPDGVAAVRAWIDAL